MRCRVSSSSSRLISVLFAREMSSQSSVPLDEAAFARVTAFLRSLLADEIRVDPKCFGRFSKERYFKNVELSQVRVVVRWFLLADPNSLRTWFGEVTHFSSDDAEDDQSLTVSYFCEAYVLDGAPPTLTNTASSRTATLRSTVCMCRHRRCVKKLSLSRV